MIEKQEIAKSVEELGETKNVKIEIELSTWEAYSFIVAVQLFKVTNSKLEKIAMVGEFAASRLQERLKDSCPTTYKLLDKGWNLK